MYKGNKKIEDLILTRSQINTSVLSETTNQVIQREIDNYTRVLEQDKRKFFRLQESKNETIREYQNKVKELDQLKSKQYKTETTKKIAELKILEKESGFVISSYNQVLGNMKKLKDQIDELRKQKKNQNEAIKKLTVRIGQMGDAIKQKQIEIKQKKESIQNSKQQILKIKQQNDEETKNFREQITQVRTNFGQSKMKGSLKRKGEIEANSQTIDTQPLVKLRLRNLINRNKDKIKIIDNYKKAMHSIWKAFEQIKEESGITDLQQITNSFLKHQEQNLFIYDYINKLNKELEDVCDQNNQLKNRIDAQRQVNNSYFKQRGQTPLKQQKTDLYNDFIAQNNKSINHFQHFLKQSEPLIRQMSKLFGLQIDENALTQFNIDQYLSEIENWISYYYKEENELKAPFKEEITKYTKLPPTINEELQTKEQKLLEGDKLREWAAEYWQKRKMKI